MKTAALIDADIFHHVSNGRISYIVLADAPLLSFPWAKSSSVDVFRQVMVADVASILTIRQLSAPLIKCLLINAGFLRWTLVCSGLHVLTSLCQVVIL
jgi:hypothetical protein